MDKQQEVKNILGVFNDLSTGHYLGLPSLVGRSKNNVFKFLKDRIWKRVNGWNMKLLSKAGKVVLLKNVASAIPSYSMSCFLIPKKLCQEIERILNSFWWSSSSSNNRGIRWLSWDRLSDSKEKGGFSFRTLYGYNLAMLGKHVWSFIRNPDSLVARIFKARYFPKTHILNAERTGGSSFIWSGICAAKDELKKGFRWVVGNGKDILVGSDPWIIGKENHKLDEGYAIDTSMKVEELLYPNLGGWNIEKVNALFNERDARAILSLRIPRSNTPERVAWTNTIDGCYTVKSGYKLWQEDNR